MYMYRSGAGIPDEEDRLPTRQRQVLNFVRSYMTDHDRFPPLRKISEEVFGTKWPSQAEQALRALCDKGFLRKDRRTRTYFFPLSQDTAALNRSSLEAPRVRLGDGWPRFDHQNEFRIDLEASKFLSERLSSYVGRGRVAVEDARLDDLGYRIDKWALPPGVSGQLIQQERLILVNRADPRRRQSFTIAHEFGHLVCHVPLMNAEQSLCSEAALLDEFEPRQAELEANFFAARIVLPTMAVIRFMSLTRSNYGAVSEVWGDARAEFRLIEHAAEEFDVSIATAGWRLVELGAISRNWQRLGP